MSDLGKLKGRRFGSIERTLLAEAILASSTPPAVTPAGQSATSWGIGRHKAARRLVDLGLIEICRHRRRRCFVLTHVGRAFGRRFAGALLFGGGIVASRFVRAIEREQQRAAAA